MKEIARKLAKGFPHVRIDLYNVDGKIYFGEFTFFHDSGFAIWEGDTADFWLGSMIDLPQDCPSK